MITTSYVDKQAYQEVVEDGHPILIVTATDIAQILKKNAINSSNINEWLSSIDRRDNRLFEYYKRINDIEKIICCIPNMVGYLFIWQISYFKLYMYYVNK